MAKPAAEPLREYRLSETQTQCELDDPAHDLAATRRSRTLLFGDNAEHLETIMAVCEGWPNRRWCVTGPSSLFLTACR
jgi:hypothetical protein